MEAIFQGFYDDEFFKTISQPVSPNDKKTLYGVFLDEKESLTEKTKLEFY